MDKRLKNGLTPQDNHDLRVLENVFATSKEQGQIVLKQMVSRGEHAALLYRSGIESVPDPNRVSYWPSPEFDGCYDEDEWFKTGKMVPPKGK